MFKNSGKKLNVRFGIVLIFLFIFVFSACKKEESVNFDEYNEQKAKQKSEKEEAKKAESLKDESKDEAGDITESVNNGESKDAGSNDSDKNMESENLEDRGSASGKDITSPQENSDPDDNSENVDVSITEDETVVTGEAEKIETIQLTTGQLVRFGSYEQDNDTSNGKEPIEWIVLSVDEEQGRALLLSRYVLDRIPLYDKEKLKSKYPGSSYDGIDWTKVSVTWENSEIRRWLNGDKKTGDFIKEAFDADESSCIIKTRLENKGNPKFGNDEGADTIDRVFLLSFEDIYNHDYGFSRYPSENDINRRCTATEYAKAKGVWTAESYREAIGTVSYFDFSVYFTTEGEGACDWVLRTPSDNNGSEWYSANFPRAYGGEISDDYQAQTHSLFGVNCEGRALKDINYQSEYGYGIRPAVYIDLDSVSRKKGSIEPEEGIFLEIENELDPFSEVSVLPDNKKKEYRKLSNVDISELVIFDSTIRKLLPSDLYGLNKDKTRFAINDIYAWEKRLFTNDEVRDYYESKKFYQYSHSGYINADIFDKNEDAYFSAIEKYNVDYLKNYREEGCPDSDKKGSTRPVKVVEFISDYYGQIGDYKEDFEPDYFQDWVYLEYDESGNGYFVFGYLSGGGDAWVEDARCYGMREDDNLNGQLYDYLTGEDLNMRYRIVPEKDDDGKERFILYVEKDGALYRYYYYDPDQY